MLKNVNYGCYADAAFGHDHIRKVLGDFAGALGDKELADSLYGDMPDDAWDEIEALEKMNEATETPGYWELHDGDLIFREEDDDEV